LDNARSPRITAAAGTKLAGASSLINVIIFISERTLQPIYHVIKLNDKSFLLSSFTQYYWIRLSPIVQDSSLLAKSLGLISVPVWLIVLPDQLRIIGLVSLYLTNNLILHKHILKQHLTFFIFDIFSIEDSILIISIFKVVSYVLLTHTPCF
jgi:hypothetical protein